MRAYSRILVIIWSLWTISSQSDGFHVPEGNRFRKGINSSFPINKNAKYNNLKVTNSNIQTSSFPISTTALLDSKGEESTLIPGINKKINWRRPNGEPGQLSKEVLAGLVGSLSTISTSIAYASIIGINPLIGVWSSALVGLLVAIVGGSPGLVVGSAGVVAIPISNLVSKFGVEFIAPTVLLASIFEVIFGKLKLGKMIKYVYPPVVAGFLNALAIFLVKSQIKVFTAASSSIAFYPTIFVASLSFIITQFIPRYIKSIPSSLLGLLVSAIVANLMQFPVRLLKETTKASVFSGGLNSLPSLIDFKAIVNIPFSWSIFQTVLFTSLGISLISILETLLASKIACDNYRCKLMDYEKDDPDKLIVGLGIGNAVTTLIGGFGGCGLIPNTLLAKGESYASEFAYSLFLALSVLMFAPLIGKIPLASIAGVMLTVAINTFEWKESAEYLHNGMKTLPIKSFFKTILRKNKNESLDSIKPNSPRDKKKDILDLFGFLTTFYLCYNRGFISGVSAGVIITNLHKIINSSPNWFKRNSVVNN